MVNDNVVNKKDRKVKKAEKKKVKEQRTENTGYGMDLGNIEQSFMTAVGIDAGKVRKEMTVKPMLESLSEITEGGLEKKASKKKGISDTEDAVGGLQSMADNFNSAVMGGIDEMSGRKKAKSKSKVETKVKEDEEDNEDLDDDEEDEDEEEDDEEDDEDE